MPRLQKFHQGFLEISALKCHAEEVFRTINVLMYYWEQGDVFYSAI